MISKLKMRLIAATALALVACASVPFRSTWKAPEEGPFALMWAAVSQSRNPSNVIELVRKLAGEALRQMEKEGVFY